MEDSEPGGTTFCKLVSRSYCMPDTVSAQKQRHMISFLTPKSSWCNNRDRHAMTYISKTVK